MRRRSLQQRLLAVVLISAIPVFIVHVAIQIVSDMRTARARATTVTQDIAAAAIPLLQSTLLVGDLATTQETLDNIMRHGQFRRLRLLKQNGSMPMVEGKPGVAAAAGQVPGWFTALLDVRFEPQQFPIQVGGTTYGTLLAEPSPAVLVADIWQRMWTAAVLWLVTAGSLFALLQITLRRGLRPLDDLAGVAHRFGAGDLSCRAAIGDVPELAATAGAFNRMADNLSEAQDRLEARVRQRTAELSESEARTSAILRNLLDGVVQIDPQGMILSVNAAVCTLFGYREAEMLGQGIDLLIPELRCLADDAHPGADPTPWQTIIPGLRHEVAGRRKDGSALSLDFTANELIYDNGRTYISVLRDIGQQKAAAAAREAARADAEQLAQAKSEFLANMSHEIRTPLNAMLGLAQVGIRKSRGRQIAQTLEQILHSGELLLRLINDILDFSKIEAHKMKLEEVAFNLGEVIDRAVDLNAPDAYAKGLGFVVAEAADLPTRCVGDPIRISQVLVNLLSNAIKFTAAGSVSLEVRRAGSALLFRVSDTGIGISDELMERLFEPFEQADSSTTRRFGGSGLGLVISRRLVELMGGEIRVASRPHVGTRIEVRLALPEVAGPARIMCPALRLLGLPAAEGQSLAHTLADHCVAVSLSTADTLPGVPTDGLLVADAAFIGAQADAARELLRQGQSLAIVCTPGIENTIPDDLAARARHLDRPLRWRHLIAAHTGRVRAHDDKQLLADMPRLAGIRILAAEDDAVSRLVLKEILELEGASLVIEENGIAACDRLAADGVEAFDVVITDIQMPLLDGYATARRMREMAPALPVIALSAHAMPEERERCFAAGMADLITKPVAIDVLVATLLQHLAGHAGKATAIPETVVEAARADTGSAASLVDWAALEARYNIKRSFVDQLAAKVLESYAQTPEKLRAAAADDDFSQMAALSHKIQGMSANLMAAHLLELARRTEDAARRQLPETKSLIEQLAADMEDVLGVLAARTSSSRPA